MKIIQAICLLLLCPALSLNTRQSYGGLEKKLKDVFSERSTILHQLSKTSKELDSIKGNLQSLRNDDSLAKKDVQRILELSHKQRDEMRSLQAALQKQLDEANERAEKQQATVKLIKVEMEKKTKIIKDLQQEIRGFLDFINVFPSAGGATSRKNKSLKNKLLSGNKLCDAYAEESKKIQAQLKELRYGKKDLIFKGQQLMDLEHKLTVAKEELEKTALDKESQLKALKDTVHICFSAVLHNDPSGSHRYPTSPTHLFRYSSLINSSRVTFQQPHAKDISKVQRIVTESKSPMNIGVIRRQNGRVKECKTEETGANCTQNQTDDTTSERKKISNQQQQQSSPEQSGNVNTKRSDASGVADGGSSKKTQTQDN